MPSTQVPNRVEKASFNRWLCLLAMGSLIAAALVAWELRRLRHLHERAAQEALELAAERDAERARLEAALAEARSRPPIFASARPEINSPPGTNALDPEALVAELTQLRIRSGPNRIRDLHEVIYRLRSLAHMGDRSVNAISGYLAKFEDVEYPSSGEKELIPVPPPDPGGGADSQTEPPGGVNPPSIPAGVATPSQRTARTNRADRAMGPRNLPTRDAGLAVRSERLQFEFLTPPSLRLGLMEVLAEIATPSAEAVLAEALQKTGRGVEVAYLARRLQALAPDRYRPLALTAARELLLHPVTLAGTGTFDRQQRAYLYSVFDFYHDESLAGLVPQLLVDSSGKLDRQAFSKLSKTLGRTEAMPWIYQAFNQLASTNAADRSRLLQNVLPVAGQDPYASAMVRDVLRDTTASAEARGFVVQSLAQMESLPGREKGEGRNKVDVAGIQAKLQFVDQLRNEFPDPTLAKSFDRVTRRLNGQLQPPAPKAGAGRRPPQ